MAVSLLTRAMRGIAGRVNRSIEFKIILLFQVVLIVVILLLATWIILDKRSELYNSALQRNLVFSRFATKYIYDMYTTYQLYYDEPETLKKLIGLPKAGEEATESVFSNNRDICRYLIVAADGEILFDSMDIGNGGLAEHTRRYVSGDMREVVRNLDPNQPRYRQVVLDGREVMEIIATNTLSSGNYIYGIAYYVSLRDIHQAITLTTLAILLAAAVLIVGTVLLSRAFARTLVKPLNRLVASAKQISQGNYGITVPVRSPDEIGVLEKAFSSMVKKINAYSKNLRKQNQELIALGKMKDEFISIISHELRTPLHGIKAMSSMMVDGLTGELSTDQKQKLNTIQASTRRLVKLVDSILDFSRLHLTDEPPRAQTADLTDVIRPVAEYATALAQEKGISFQVQAPSGLPSVYIDPDKTEQILFNLVGNAFKFTEKGHVAVRAEEQGDQVKVAVTDTGIGIKMTDIARIFTPFAQVEPANTRAYGGTGLGLAIARRLVEIQGGHIWVESTPGTGSTFYFTLPCTAPERRPGAGEPKARKAQAPLPVIPAAVEEAATEPASFSFSGQGESILVVEDDPVSAEALAGYLNARHYHARVAGNGKQALDMIDQQMPDLVLLDLMMPGMSGYDVLRTLRRERKLYRLPIIILSAKGEKKDLLQGMALGANDYLVKPFDMDELFARLSTHLQLSLYQKKISYLSRFLNDVIQDMPIIFITISQSGIVSHWNVAAERTFGSTSDQMTGKNLWQTLPELQPLQGPCAAVWQDGPRRIYQQDVPWESGETRYFNIFLFLSAGTEQPLLVLEMIDVTEEVKKNQRLQQAQKMELVGNLVGGVAHDFNNSLSGIMGPISLLKHNLTDMDFSGKEGMREDWRNYLNLIEHSAIRASSLVSKLLALSRKRRMRHENLDLRKAVEDVLAICRNTFSRSVTIHTDLPEEAWIDGDATLIEQVILNLCLNGYQAMTTMRAQPGKIGGILYISLSEQAMEESGDPGGDSPGRTWRLEVADTGVGMDPGTRQKIFDPFFTARKANGTGLGLAMVQHIVKLHAGWIDVRSIKGKGSSFILYLPAVVPPQPCSEPADIIPFAQGRGKVLVIDDEDLVRDTAMAILKTCGYQVLTAAGGKQGLAIFNRNPAIAVVMLDLDMPVMDGREIFGLLREKKPKIPVIVTSGFENDPRLEELLAQERVRFLPKPFDVDSLSTAVERLLAANG